LVFRINCATVGVNEQSLKNAAAKTVKYTRMYHQDSLKLNDNKITDQNQLKELKFSYPSLTSDNVQFSFDDYGLLHIKFVNIKATITGKNYLRFLFGILTDFTAQLSNFNWEQVFVVSKKDLGNGKLDIKFKSTEESEVNFSIFRFTSQRQNMKELPFPIEQTIKGNLKKLDFTPVKNQLKKIAQLILETLQSDLK
jgi:hypothetical protein